MWKIDFAVLALLVSPMLAQAPVLLGDLRPGSIGSRPPTYLMFGQLGQRTVFNADDGSGNEPWITDGTPAGTYRLGDLYPGATGSTPSEYATIGSRVVFAAYLPLIGQELAVSDGTVAGTGVLADLWPGIANSNPYGFVPFRDEVVFTADLSGGRRPWRTDGTPGGTFAHPVLPAHCEGGLVAGNRLFWFRRTGPADELWGWDGITAPAVVQSFPRAGGQPSPYLIGAVRHRALIAGAPSNNAVALWSSDGTAAGTQPFVVNLAMPVSVAVANDRVFFCATNATPVVQLWVSDGTTAGTTPVVQTAGTHRSLWTVGDRAFLSFATAWWSTLTVCVSDGSAAGTQFLSRDLGDLVAVGSRRAAFVASDTAHGAEIWLTDGTAAGTTLFADVRPGTASAFDHVRLLHYRGGKLVFWADDGVHGPELFALHTGAGAQVLGGGCNDGPIPQLFGDDPELGGQVTVRGRSQLPASPGFVVLGLASIAPAALGPCALHVDLGFPPMLIPFSTDAAGTFTLPSLQVPALPALDGFRLAAQAALVAPSGPVAGVAISTGVLLTIGW